MKKQLSILLIISFFVSASCKSIETQKTDTSLEAPGFNIIKYKIPDNYNFKFIAIDTEIENPVNDRRSYYKIYIDKIEEGRTTTGLESQSKSFKIMLSSNRHLLSVEKWVIDKNAGRYVKLNNIEQPKPNYVYFNTQDNRIVIINMKSGKNGKTNFSQRFDTEE